NKQCGPLCAAFGCQKVCVCRPRLCERHARAPPPVLKSSRIWKVAHHEQCRWKACEKTCTLVFECDEGVWLCARHVKMFFENPLAACVPQTLPHNPSGVTLVN